MERQLIPFRKTIFWTLLLAALLWYFWSFLFPKELDNADIIVMKKSYTMDSTGFVYIGVKNISKSRPGQYKDFLPKVAASIADTAHEKTYIYFLMDGQNIRQRIQYWHPYELEEEVPDRLLLRQHWKKGSKEPEYVRWYIPALQYLNN